MMMTSLVPNESENYRALVDNALDYIERQAS